jgi:gamma-glutamylcysteine synthetase
MTAPQRTFAITPPVMELRFAAFHPRLETPQLGLFSHFHRNRDQFGPDDAERKWTNHRNRIYQGFRTNFFAEFRTESASQWKTRKFSGSGCFIGGLWRTIQSQR